MGAAENLPHLYTEAEAAEYLGVSEVTLYRWRRSGKIGFVAIGQKPRYTDHHLTDYLKAQECSASNLASTGSSAAKAPQTGNVRGTTAEASSNALRLAHQILSEQKLP